MRTTFGWGISRVRRGGCLPHAEAQRAQRWRIEPSLPLSPAGCGRGIAAAWSSGRRFPSPPTRQCGIDASGTRRPRRAAPTQGPGRGSPRRASSPTSPERACGSRPRAGREREDGPRAVAQLLQKALRLLPAPDQVPHLLHRGHGHVERLRPPVDLPCQVPVGRRHAGERALYDLPVPEQPLQPARHPPVGGRQPTRLILDLESLKAGKPRVGRSHGWHCVKPARGRSDARLSRRR